MTKKDELLQKLETVTNEVKALKTENKIEEAHAKLTEIKDLKKAIEVEEALETEEMKEIENKIELGKDDKKMENKELMEIRAREEKIFANYVRTAVKNDMKAGTNGVLIPTTISSRIIEKVEEMCPIYARATKFNVGGDLVFVKEATIPTTAYMDEMAPASATDATFTTVKLEAFIARALTKVSRSLINRSDFDVVSYIVNAVAKSIARFLEKELINGTVSKRNGLKAVTPETVSAINADALIDLQMTVPSSLQGGCEWLMNPADVKTVRKLKDSTGAYLFHADPTSAFGYRLLGKDVMMSDQVPAQTIFYGDFSGLYVKLAKDIEVNVLLEKYADEYCVGVLGFVELDADVVESQKIAAIKVEG